MRLVDHAAERVVVGALLLRADAIDVVEAECSPEDFDDGRLRAVLEAALQVHRRGDVVDIASIETELRRVDRLGFVGGVEAVGKLADTYVTAHHAEHHAKRVRKVAIARAMQDVLADALDSSAREALDDPDAWVDRVTGSVLTAAERTATIGYEPLSQLMHPMLDGMLKRHNTPDGLTGVSTGFPTLDAMTAGLQPCDLAILAARPSMGKTTLMGNMAVASDRDNAPALVISLEQPKLALAERLVVARASVAAQSARSGKLSDTDVRRVVNACGSFEHSTVQICDVARINILQIRNLARRFCRQFRIEKGGRKGTLWLDYIGLAKGSGQRKGRDYVREQEIAEISGGLKEIAKETGLAVVALAQLNRESERRGDPKPKLSDLRESGAIEQDADLVIFPFRPGYYESDPEKKKKFGNRADLIVAKQRNGPTGSVRLEFIDWKYLFVEPRQSARGEGE